jgi:hypothetical protein
MHPERVVVARVSTVVAAAVAITIVVAAAVVAAAVGAFGSLILVLTQKVHSAPITQQAEKLASHAQRESDVPVNFS